MLPNRKVLFHALLFSLLFLIFVPAAKGQSAMGGTFYVTKAGGASVKSGNSWAEALDEAEFRTKLANANGSDQYTFYVAKGTYTPGNMRGYSFAIRNNVRLYGGFAGTETGAHDQLIAARNFSANVTVLTGDIDNNDTKDGNGVTTEIIGSNTLSIVTTTSGCDSSARLDGRRSLPRQPAAKNDRRPC